MGQIVFSMLAGVCSKEVGSYGYTAISKFEQKTKSRKYGTLTL